MNHNNNKNDSESMASKLSDTELPSNNTFIEVEQLIRSTFDRIIRAATERREQLLEQLSEMWLEYLNKQETRKKQVSEIQLLISQIKGTSIQQNPVVKLQEEQVSNLEEQIEYQKPTPVPVPSISTEGLESLLEQLMGFGTVKDVRGPYEERNKPIRNFGREGNKKGELRSPTGLALYRNESIYIADTNNRRIQIFSTAGKFLSEFGKQQLSRPHSVALSDKWVFVSDAIVFKFQITNNKFVCQSARRELDFPWGIAVDTNGDLLVADNRNNRIAVLGSELELVGEIGKDKLTTPCDVKLNNNKIVVADSNESHNIHIFTKSGDMIRSFIHLDKGTGFIYLCFDFYNNIIVCDYISLSIQIFTIDGELIHRIVCKNIPGGIAVDNNNNIICVCKNGVVDIY